MSTSTEQHSQAPEDLAHRFLLIHHSTGDWYVFRFSGTARSTEEMTHWVARLCAKEGADVTVYAGEEQAWPPHHMIDIADDVAADWEPF